MAFAINLVDYDSECPDIIGDSESMMCDHLRAEVGGTAKELILCDLVLEIRFISYDCAI